VELAQKGEPSLERLLGCLLDVKTEDLVGDFVGPAHHTKRTDIAFGRVE
jgi:hypothetical protein